MASTRRLGAVNSETRALLIDAGARILSEKGAAAVTARSLAETVGLQRHIVHYYFGTIDELFVALLQRDTVRTREWLADALKSEDPIRVIWALGKRAATQTLEFSVLAARSVAIRNQFKASSEEFRNDLTHALEQHLHARGITTKLSPISITLALQAIAYSISIEELLGITEGHAAMRELTDNLIAVLITPEPSP